MKLITLLITTLLLTGCLQPTGDSAATTVPSARIAQPEPITEQPAPIIDPTTPVIDQPAIGQDRLMGTFRPVNSTDTQTVVTYNGTHLSGTIYGPISQRGGRSTWCTIDQPVDSRVLYQAVSYDPIPYYQPQGDAEVISLAFVARNNIVGSSVLWCDRLTALTVTFNWLDQHCFVVRGLGTTPEMSSLQGVKMCRVEEQ